MNWVIRNWILVAGSLAALSALGSLLEVQGFHDGSALLLWVGWVAAGVLALVDGFLRAIGRSSLLGTGQGLGRALALLQLLLAILLLGSLLGPATSP